jgi:hypothetical protein
LQRRTPILDLVCLTHQCQGDSALEDELLLQFRLQTRALCVQLSDPAGPALEAKGRIAHKLRGSALAIGASRVADAARHLESEIEALVDATPGTEARLSGAIARLQAAAAEAIVEIDRIRG